MKKLAAMLLALCVLLAAVPALGEDFSGTWYLTLATITMGSFELNEDGTMTASMPGLEEPMTGTWTADGDTVTMTIDGSDAEFTYDGTALTGALIPVPLTREEGTISYELITKMMNGEEYELPEGLTEMDLLSAAMTFVTEYSKLTGATGGSEATPEPEAEATATPAPAEKPNATILQENFLVVESFTGYRAMYLAKLRNDTDTVLYVTDGILNVSNAVGDSVGLGKYLSTCGSRYLEPGEVSFISIETEVSENTGLSWDRTLTVKTSGYINRDRAVTLTDPSFAQETYNSTMQATVINDADEPLPGLTVVYALEDADGNLLDIASESLYRHVLGADSSITLVTSVDSRVMEYCKANGIEPAVVEAFAYVEAK